MKIIPVIDLKDGEVVHAREGKRDQYQSLKTRICATADIFQIIDAFIAQYRFDTVYIADLNAIAQQGNHNRLIEEVMNIFPQITFWLDRGRPQGGKELKMSGSYLPVLGSESYRDENISELEAIADRFILSLDYAFAKKLGAKSIFSSPKLWPENIIIMTLDRVGTNLGPDFVKLREFCIQYPQKKIIAAGGIRNLQDLLDLKRIGVQKALIASAIHSGSLSCDDIKNL